MTDISLSVAVDKYYIPAALTLAVLCSFLTNREAHESGCCCLQDSFGRVSSSGLWDEHQDLPVSFWSLLELRAPVQILLLQVLQLTAVCQPKLHPLIIINRVVNTQSTQLTDATFSRFSPSVQNKILLFLLWILFIIFPETFHYIKSSRYFCLYHIHSSKICIKLKKKKNYM